MQRTNILGGEKTSDDDFSAPDFQISPTAVVESREGERGTNEPGSTFDFDAPGELPRASLGSGLYALARDPVTLFAYWEIDWQRVFGDDPPAGRLVHLRVLAEDGAQESSAVVEPLIGSCFVSVSNPGRSYRLEIGFYQPENTWNLVATSGLVPTPPHEMQEPDSIAVATVPFHLNFQRLIEMIEAAQRGNETWMQTIARLQERGDDPAQTNSLTPAERDLLRAINARVSENEAVQRRQLRSASGHFARQYGETLPGPSATSPAGAFDSNRS